MCDKRTAQKKARVGALSLRPTTPTGPPVAAFPLQSASSLRVVTPSPTAAAAALSQVPRPSLVSSPATSTHQGTGLRMQSLVRNVCRAGSRGAAARLLELAAAPVGAAHPGAAQPSSAVKHLRQPYGFARPVRVDQSGRVQSRVIPAAAVSGFGLCAKVLVATRGLSTVGNAAEVGSDSDDFTSPAVEHPPRIKFKRPDKTARHIMNILNKEAVEKVRSEREIPDVQPGCMIQMRLQVPENKRRELTLKGIVLGRRNAGINTTFRLRRLVSGVGVESVFPLYSPNIKEIKILDRKKVRRAKLYYLRDRVNALKK